ALDADAASIELQVALRVTEELEELWVLDLDGAPVAAAAAGELLTVEEVAPRSEVDLLLLASGPRARVDRSGPRHVLELSVPVESPPGTADGVLIARADLSRVADEVARPRGDGVRASLVATDGTTLADRDPARVEAEYRHPLADLPAERPVARVVGPEGPTLVAAAPLRTLDGFVVVEQLESALLEEATGLRGPAGVLLVVVIAIVAAVLATAQRLLRPLGPLASAVGRLREGELGARVDESGTGEVADLARGFNAMAVSLEARRRELEDAERDARMSEERLRLVVEGVQDYAIVLLDVLGAVRTWNAGARRVTGCEAGDIIGHRITSLADPTRSVDDPLAEATTTGRGESEGWYLRPDGSRYYGQLTVTTLRRDDGTPYGYAAILQDVTHRQLAQEALEEALRREQEAAAELRSANEVKDEFLNVAAHEIRTPLSAILGASQLLAGGPGVLDEDETEEIQQLIWRHASDMRDIVERLLDFTQLQAGRVHLAPGPLRLRTEFERVVTNVGRLLTDHQVVREAPDVIVE
ncbi:MAG: histidine kinase dimerization/phospho-acceptor domain-containing protein, partial [Nitriliruptor sp.]